MYSTVQALCVCLTTPTQSYTMSFVRLGHHNEQPAYDIGPNEIMSEVSFQRHNDTLPAREPNGNPYHLSSVLVANEKSFL